MIYSCKIESDRVFLNGELQKFKLKGESDWKKELYQQLGMDYPKFYKMDALAKMATLGVTLLKKIVDFDQFGEDDLVLIFANASSSGEVDKKFISSYQDKGNPSPSLFVYTLPNILTGELSILNKWYGENIFFINENFSAAHFLEQINIYFSKGAKACLCGWVEDGKKQECVLFFVINDGEEIAENELINSYNQ